MHFRIVCSLTHILSNSHLLHVYIYKKHGEVGKLLLFLTYFVTYTYLCYSSYISCLQHFIVLISQRMTRKHGDYD